MPPTSVTFERTQRSISTEEDGAPETRLRVDRWDGKQLTLVSINGKPPTQKEAEEYRKATAGRPVPSYHRLASFLGQGARRVPDAKGRVVYRVDKLPKGSINIGRDISANVAAEAIVDTSGPKPFVSRLRIVLPKPLSFFMVAKLDSFEAENEYRLGPDGRPVLVHQKQTISGAQMGTSGSYHDGIALSAAALTRFWPAWDGAQTARNCACAATRRSKPTGSAAFWVVSGLLPLRFPGYASAMKLAILGLPIALVLMAAAPAVDPVRDRIIAQAQAINPATLAFERTTNQIRKGGGTSSGVTTLERWDGKRWTLVSVNGKQPDAVRKARPRSRRSLGAGARLSPACRHAGRRHRSPHRCPGPHGAADPGVAGQHACAPTAATFPAICAPKRRWPKPTARSGSNRCG